MASNTGQIHFRVPTSVKKQWDKVLADRKTTVQMAGVGLIEWIIKQTPATQAIVFGMVPDEGKGK